MVDHHTYRVTWSAEDEEFVGLCTEFPSLSWLEPTQQEAFRIRKLVADDKANGETPPEPSAPTAGGSWFPPETAWRHEGC